MSGVDDGRVMSSAAVLTNGGHSRPDILPKIYFVRINSLVWIFVCLMDYMSFCCSWSVLRSVTCLI